MSVYCTWLLLEHPEQRSAALAASGIEHVMLGDDTHERDIGSPYVYRGSHVVPRDGDPRGGSLDFASVPNFLHPDADRDGPDDDMTHRVEFIRLGVREDPATYHHEDHLGDATVVLDRRQVTELRDTLTAWLDAAERW